MFQDIAGGFQPHLKWYIFLTLQAALLCSVSDTSITSMFWNVHLSENHDNDKLGAFPSLPVFLTFDLHDPSVPVHIFCPPWVSRQLRGLALVSDMWFSGVGASWCLWSVPDCNTHTHLYHWNPCWLISCLIITRCHHRGCPAHWFTHFSFPNAFYKLQALGTVNRIKGNGE